MHRAPRQELKGDVTTGRESPPRTAILVTSHPGQHTVAQLADEAARGLRPRVDYVELAGAVNGEVFDLHRLHRRWENPLAAAVLRYPAGRAAGQVLAALLASDKYDHVVAWADRLGLPLAVLAKASRRDLDLVMISVLMTSPKKRFLLRHLRAHTRIRAIVTPSSVQAAKAVSELGVPAGKLHHFPQRVDHLYWRPLGEVDKSGAGVGGAPRSATAGLGRPAAEGTVILSVGWENRDYNTLASAAPGLDATIQIAIGSVVLGPVTSSGSGGRSALEALRQTSGYRRLRQWEGALLNPPPNVVVHHQLSHPDLRLLYERARFCVLPVHEIDTDNGATALAEAMAMGKAVIVSRTTGQVDLMRDGKHGLMVPPGDVRALHQAMRYLLEHPEEAERMGRAGRAEVLRRHTLDGYIARLVSLIGS